MLALALPAVQFWPRKTSVHLNKLLVLIDGKWRVFNGEVQGYDELDLSWLSKVPSARAAL